MPIQRLSPLLVNQIAAGEVVERPASVVKELIENAIDADANHLRIEIDRGGLERIQIADDGSGIAEEELPLAVESHATSKISTPTDLDGVSTMGFRGEALASITSVARVEIRSRTPGSDHASVIEVEGDRQEGPRPASGPVGTMVTVHQLFGHVPARRKFMKSEPAEMRRISRIVQRIAMSHPDIAFTLVSNGRTTLELPQRSNARMRILDVMGNELDSQMLDLDTTRDGVRLWGLVGLPEVARPTSQHQQIYLNGRPINDRSLSHALREAYRGLIEPSRHPTAILFIQMDPSRVDVNVHPAKTEVRFRDDRLLHSVVRRGVLECLESADLTPSIGVMPTPDLPSSGSRLFGVAGRHSGGSAVSGGGSGASHRSATSSSSSAAGPRGFEMEEARRLEQEVSEIPQAASISMPSPSPRSTALQVHKTFVVTEDEHGLVIIDQHALHERVMFEKLLERVSSGPLASQQMLVPEIIDAGDGHFEGLEQLSPLLPRLGLDVSPSGPRSISIHAFPSLLMERRVAVGAFVSDLLERAGSGGIPVRDHEEALREVLDMMACKAAVKAGDQLTAQELADLLEMRELVERSSNCPHGRPTTLRLSIEDLERQFGRR
ncbi:MAG: DNA mismatch repair protein MutL [Phycisphaerae bacterium]|nr:DNA mismatch repair protein MutL [Phycisphaerae bacterium]